METGLANLFSRGAKETQASGATTDSARTGPDMGSEGWAQVYHAAEGPHVHETGAEPPATDEKMHPAKGDPTLSSEPKAAPNDTVLPEAHESSPEEHVADRFSHLVNGADPGKPPSAQPSAQPGAQHHFPSVEQGVASEPDGVSMPASARADDGHGSTAPPPSRYSVSDRHSARERQLPGVETAKETRALATHATESPKNGPLASGAAVETRPKDPWNRSTRPPNAHPSVVQSRPAPQTKSAAFETVDANRPTQPAQHGKPQTTFSLPPQIAGGTAASDDSHPREISAPLQQVAQSDSRFDSATSKPKPLTVAPGPGPHDIPHKQDHASVEFAVAPVRPGAHLNNASQTVDSWLSRTDQLTSSHAASSIPKETVRMVDAWIKGSTDPRAAAAPMAAAPMKVETTVPSKPVENSREVSKSPGATDANLLSKKPGSALLKGAQTVVDRLGDGLPRSPVGAASVGGALAQDPEADKNISPRDTTRQTARQTPPVGQPVAPLTDRPHLIGRPPYVTTSDRFNVKPALYEPMQSSGTIVTHAEELGVQEIVAHPAAGPVERVGPLAATAALPPVAFGKEKVPPVVQQMTAHLKTGGPDDVEITLNPRELGSVRMVLSPTESGLLLSLSLERAETHDLIRRHIDLAEKMFRELGFADLSIDVSLGENRPEPQNEDNDGAGDVPTAENTSVTRIGGTPSNMSVQTAGLDIRV